MSIVKIHITIAIILQKAAFFKSIRVLYYTIIPSRDELIFSLIFYQVFALRMLNTLLALKRENYIYFDQNCNNFQVYGTIYIH